MSSCEDAENPDGGDDKQREDMQSLDKMLSGFQLFIEGKGELEGSVTKHHTGAPRPILAAFTARMIIRGRRILTRKS